MKKYGSLTHLSNANFDEFRNGINLGLAWTQAIKLLGITKQSWYEARADFFRRHEMPTTVSESDLHQLKNRMRTKRDENILTILTIEFGPERVKGCLFHLEQIKNAALKGNWRASAWLLEKGFPDIYGTKNSVAPNDYNDHEVKVLIDKEDIESILNKYRELGVVVSL